MKKPIGPCHEKTTETHFLRFVFLFFLLFASVVLIGIRIPLSYLPGVGKLSLQVLVEYRGAFEREIERIITVPLENALSEIQGVEEVFSLTEPGQSRIHLILSEKSNLEDAYLETREVVDRLYIQFPPAVQRPLILRSDPRNDPVFIAAFPIRPDVSEEELKRRFQAVEGVGEVEVGGGTKEETVIRWIPDRGLSARIVPFRIGEVVRAWNVSGGFGTSSSLPMKLHRLLMDPKEIEQVPLRSFLTVKDVAEVMKQQVPQERRARVNGAELLVLYLRLSGDGNPLQVSEQLNLLCRSIPGNSILYDRGAKIRSALEELFWALGIGVICVVILTGIFLKALLPSFLVSLAIPFSTFSALTVLHLLGKTLDVVSISALTVGAGLVIDSGEILTDRFLERGDGSLKKVLLEVKDPILLSTLTTIGVFLPLIFASSGSRIQFEPLAFTLSAQLGASLLYTLVFLPVFLTHRSRSPTSSFQSRISPLRQFVFNHNVPIRLSILVTFLFLLGGGITFLFLLPKGEEKLNDLTQLDFLLEFESGVPLEQVVFRSEPLEGFLSRYPGVDQVRVKYERERATFSLHLSIDGKDQTGGRDPKGFFGFSPQNKRAELLQVIRQKASTIPQGFLFLPDSSRGGSSIAVVLTGQDTLDLQATALAFALYLQGKLSPTPPYASSDGKPYSPLDGASISEPLGIVFHFKEPLPSKRILLDPHRTNLFGLTPSEIRDYLYASLSEPVIDKSITPDGETDIRISFPKNWIRDSNDLLSLPIPGSQGTGVRLSDVSSMEEKNTPRRIYRTNRRRSVSFTILSDLEDPTPRIESLRKLAREYPFPEGVLVEIGKEWEETFQNSKRNLFLLGLSFCVLLLILLAFYQELTYPLLVILQIPLFLSFSLWALWFFQIPLSLSGAVGLLLTGGVGVNNALLVFPIRKKVIDPSNPFALAARVDVSSPLDRFRRSFRSMLTATLTTIAGIIPLLFQHGFFPSQALVQTTPLASLSLVVVAGSGGSLFVLLGMVILLEPSRPKGENGKLPEQPEGRLRRRHPPSLCKPPSQGSVP